MTDGDDDPQLIAKLRGLERMHLAGLIDDATYQARHARLQEQMAAARGSARAPATPRHRAPASAPRPPAPPVPEMPVAPAPAPLVVSSATPPTPPPAAAESEHLEPVSLAAVLAPPPPAAEKRAGPPGLRGVLIASAVAIAILGGGATAAIVATRTHSSPSGGVEVKPRTLSTATPDAAAILAGLRTAAPAAGDVVIDASAAETLVRAYWPVRERALADHDRLTVRELESGAAAQWDGRGCTIGCAPTLPRSIEELDVFVPRQTTYPAAFMAEVLTTKYIGSEPMVEIMVFSRPAREEPWSLTLDTGYTGDSLNLVPVPAEGGAYDADAPAVPGVDQPHLPQLYAAYLQHWIDHGSAPLDTPLRAGPYTTAVGQAVHEQLLEDRANGIADTPAYTADPAVDGVWTFAARTDASADSPTMAITCGTTRFTVSAVSTRSGGVLLQDQGFSPFGTLLAPGAYASVTQQGVHQSCFVSGGGAAQVTVTGNNGSATAVTGVIAHAPT